MRRAGRSKFGDLTDRFENTRADPVQRGMKLSYEGLVSGWSGTRCASPMLYGTFPTGEGGERR